MTVAIIESTGILDGVTSNELRQEVRDAIEQGANNILIDFREVTFINSSGLGALVATLKSVRASGGELYLCSLNDQVRIVLELTNMENVFKIFKDRSEFKTKVVNP